MKIAVLGASVSHQTVHHQTGAITGYCEVIRREHLVEIGADELLQITYPGNRFSDGGIIRMRDVLIAKPDICIIEPLIEDVSRGVEATREEVEYVYGELLRHGIQPLALFLAEPPHRLSPRLVGGYELHKAVCEKFSIPMVEIDLTNIEHLESMFVSVHTLLPGANLYARKVVEALKSLPAKDARLPREPSDIQVHVDPYRGGPTYRRNQLIIESDNDCMARIIQKQSIGPHSPLLDVEQNNGTEINREVRSVWDPYCHYSRDSFVTIFSGTIQPGTTTISFSCSETAPPHERARHPLTAWPSAVAKELRPLGPWHLITNGSARFA